jgi:hypothetical protein
MFVARGERRPRIREEHPVSSFIRAALNGIGPTLHGRLAWCSESSRANWLGTALEPSHANAIAVGRPHTEVSGDAKEIEAALPTAAKTTTHNVTTVDADIPHRGARNKSTKSSTNPLKTRSRPRSYPAILQRARVSPRRAPLWLYFGIQPTKTGPAGARPSSKFQAERPGLFRVLSQTRKERERNDALKHLCDRAALLVPLSRRFPIKVC